MWLVSQDEPRNAKHQKQVIEEQKELEAVALLWKHHGGWVDQMTTMEWTPVLKTKVVARYHSVFGKSLDLIAEHWPCYENPNHLYP